MRLRIKKGSFAYRLLDTLERRPLLVLPLAIVLFILLANIFGDGWIVYIDGPYRGKVVDAETGAPLEGVVIAGVWDVEVAAIADSTTTYCDVQEAVTDKYGRFSMIPGWCISPWPLAHLVRPDFTIFKPGYFGHRAATFPQDTNGNVMNETNNLGEIRLKRAETDAQRRRAIDSFDIPSVPLRLVPRKVRKTVDMMNQERAHFGMEPLYSNRPRSNL